LLASSVTPLKVLVLDADSEGSNVKSALLSTPVFANANITVMDFGATPSLATLKQYDAVLNFTNFRPSDPTGLGNALADYVDAGGGLVMATYSFSSSWLVSGRITSPGYSPFQVLPPGNGFKGSQQFHQLTGFSPTNPIFAGISGNPSYWTNSNYTNPTVDPGATVLAKDTNGNNVVAINSKNNIVDISIFPGFLTLQGLTTDAGIYRLFANALIFAHNHIGTVTQPPTANAGGPYGVIQGNSVTLNAGASSDPNPNGLPLTFSWTINGVANAATGVSPTLTFAQLQSLGITGLGTFNVQVHVTDNLGASADSPVTTLTVVPPQVVAFDSVTVPPNGTGTSTALQGFGVTATVTGGKGLTLTTTVDATPPVPVVGTVVATTDIQTIGNTAGATLTAKFYYPARFTGAAAAGLTLTFVDPATGKTVNVMGLGPDGKSLVRPQNVVGRVTVDGQTFGGYFLVTLNSTTTTPKLPLLGTVFAITVVNPTTTTFDIRPLTASTSLAPVESTQVTFVRETQLSLALTATPALTPPGAASGGGDDELEDELRKWREANPLLVPPAGITLPDFILDLLTPRDRPQSSPPTRPPDRPKLPVRPEEESRLDPIDAIFAADAQVKFLPATDWDDVRFAQDRTLGTPARADAPADEDLGTGPAAAFAAALVGISQWRPLVQRDKKRRGARPLTVGESDPRRFGAQPG
jgi:hypothetical protein